MRVWRGCEFWNWQMFPFLLFRPMGVFFSLFFWLSSLIRIVFLPPQCRHDFRQYRRYYQTKAKTACADCFRSRRIYGSNDSMIYLAFDAILLFPYAEAARSAAVIAVIATYPNSSGNGWLMRQTRAKDKCGDSPNHGLTLTPCSSRDVKTDRRTIWGSNCSRTRQP